MSIYPFKTFNRREFLQWNLAQPIQKRISADYAAFEIQRYAVWHEVTKDLEPIRAKQQENNYA